jgi:hypothetical protein
MCTFYLRYRPYLWGSCSEGASVVQSAERTVDAYTHRNNILKKSLSFSSFLIVPLLSHYTLPGPHTGRFIVDQ